MSPKTVDDDACPGTGECHGSASWCLRCGDVGNICPYPHCMAHHCFDCDRHPVFCHHAQCLSCLEKEEQRVLDEEQTARIERAERYLLEMHEKNYVDDALQRHARYIKALLDGYRGSAWDFTMREHHEQHPEETAL